MRGARTFRLIPKLEGEQTIPDLGNSALSGIDSIRELIAAAVETHHNGAAVVPGEGEESGAVGEVHGGVARVRHAVDHVRVGGGVVQRAVLRRAPDPDRRPRAAQRPPVRQAPLRRRHVREVRREREELEPVPSSGARSPA